MTHDRGHAAVLGGSWGGLLAARVLSDHYDRVTVLERDILPRAAQDRRGVPQGRHAHALLAGGAQALEELFPGILAELTAAGAAYIDDLSRLHFSPLGHLLSRQPYPQERLHQPSRALLEATVRARVRAIPNVKVCDGYAVRGLLSTPDRGRVTGVRFEVADCPMVPPDTMDADLVVDAMGRGARTPAWLAELGYPQAPEEQVRIDLTYVSQRLRVRSTPGDCQLYVVGPVPGRMTGLAAIANEDDTWLFTVFGYGSAQPRPEREAMLEACVDMLPPDALAAFAAAEPVGEIRTHHFPYSRRRHYERLERMPDGLLVFGDALCSFNPIYGQGLSVSAHEALALRACLAEDRPKLAHRFFRAAARPVDVAWQLSVGSDLALPAVAGPRPLAVRVTNAYVARVMAAAENDPAVAAQFLRVSSLVDPPTRLFRPYVLRRAALGARPAPVAVTSAVTSAVRRTPSTAQPATDDQAA